VEKEIDFKALRATAAINSVTDPRWCQRFEKSGSEPPDVFSLRGDVVGEVTTKLYELQSALGPPPADLVVSVVEPATILASSTRPG